MEVSNLKENKEIGTISFEVRIPMKKPKIFMKFFYVSFWKNIFIFGFKNFIFEENKNIYGNAFITSKSHWKNRAREWQRSCIQLCCHFAREWPKLHFFYIRLKQNNRLLKKFTIQLPTVDWATIKFSTILGVVLTKLWYCSSLYGSSKNMGTI